MSISKLKSRFYYSLVESDPMVQAHYEGYKDSNPLYHKPVSYTHLDVYKRQGVGSRI